MLQPRPSQPRPASQPASPAPPRRTCHLRHLLGAAQLVYELVQKVGRQRQLGDAIQQPLLERYTRLYLHLLLRLLLLGLLLLLLAVIQAAICS